MRLGKVQKRIVNAMNDGWELMVTRHCGAVSISLVKDWASTLVQKRVFDSLLKRDILKHAHKHNRVSFYVLTDVGKVLEVEE